MARHFLSLLRRTACAALAALGAVCAGSDEPSAEPDPVVRLEPMVVTALRGESPWLTSPVAVGYLDSLEIEERPAATMADLLRSLPGVQVADNTLPGMQRLRIRGEDARRCLVLIDGQEVSDHTTYGPPLLMDPALVQRIEVVRGPHSTLYGSRAEGGVVNLITRRPGNAPWAGAISATYSGATGGNRLSASTEGRSGPWDWRLALSRSRDGDRHLPSGRLEDSASSSQSGQALLGWSQGAHALTLLIDRHELQSEASTQPRILDGVAVTAFRLDLPRRDRSRVSLFYDGRDLSSAWKNLHVDAYAQRIDRLMTQSVSGNLLPLTRPPTTYSYFNEDADVTDSTGLNAYGTWVPWTGHTLRAGFSWVRDDLDKSLRRTGVRVRGTTTTPANLNSVLVARIETAALYAQETWDFAPGWSLSGGLRQYFVRSALRSSSDPALHPRQSRDARVIGSAAVVWNPRKDFSLRAAWGQGYVYPTLLHQHTGSLFAQGNLTRPNPLLRPEQSQSAELGLRWSGPRLTLDATVFASEARDYIESVRAALVPELGWPPGDNTYANLARARSRGGELSASYRLWLGGPEAYAQSTWVRREVEYPTLTTADNGQPRWTGCAGLRQSGTLGTRGASWHADAYAAWGGPSWLRTPRSVERAGGWATANLSGGLRWGGAVRWSLSLELRNLANASYRPSNDELPQPGRHANLGMRSEF